MQVTSGIYRILSVPFVYELVQRIFGAEKGRRALAENLNLGEGGFLLDVGCGPADILEHLPDINYYGFDISEAYIKNAQKRYSSRGTFICGLFSKESAETLPKFDAVLLSGLLHHLDDTEARELLENCLSVLKPGGRVFTIDPCYTEKQNQIARILIKLDRGKNVRTEDGYRNLFPDDISSISCSIQHVFLPPYTRCKMVVIR